jgi:hypothetical protein
MHKGHDHEHHHRNGAGAGHNHARPMPGAAQWQTPHRPDQDHDHEHEPDLDLVEAAFVEGFTAASDPTSFLRLAQIPFETTDGAGKKLVLLRIETEAATDVGAVMPHVGGETFRYDPLPAALVSRRRSLRFVYFDGAKLCPLSLTQVREQSGL